MVQQPSGTITLVFTDIESSTRLLQELGRDAYREALAEHRRIVREACARHAGYEVDCEGDSFFYAFKSAVASVSAVEEAMAALAGGPIRIRVGIHTGEPGLDPPKYVGVDVHLAARVMAAGHGGQVLLSRATRDHVDLDVLDLGEHRLKDFAEPVSIFQLGSREFPPLRTISNTNLPRPASSFIGRERAVAELMELLTDDARFVTLTGPGGSGKTRLAIEVAADLIPHFKAGVFWVGLSALKEPALVMGTIARTIGAKGSVVEQIGERQLLLLLDNLEQVVASAPELAVLVERCPKLRLLVTSRELLRVRGEREYPVLPLSERDAVELFCTRAGTNPDENVRALCRALDQLPLALELAAARTSVLAPAQILDRLAHRLDLLKGGRDADPRQQTLRATMEWSYGLLTLEERRLFARLAVFSPGCTLEAATRVAGAELDTLQSLVEKSLLRHTEGRFWMLETIREYALERLDESGETDAVRQAHATFFLALAETAAPELDGAEQREWLARLEHEHGNLRAALSCFSSSQQGDLSLRLASSLWQFWDMHGHFAEGREWIVSALAQVSEEATPLRAWALHRVAVLAFRQGDYRQARRWAEESLSTGRALADSKLVAWALIRLGIVDVAEGEYERAVARYEQALALCKDEGDVVGVRTAIIDLGVLELARGEYDRAAEFFEQVVVLSQQVGDEWTRSAALSNLALVAFEQSRPAQARALGRDALEIAVALDAKQLICESLVLAAALDDCDPSSTARLLGAAATLQGDIGYSLLEGSWPRLHERTLAAVRGRLGSQAFESCWAEGAEMGLKEAVAYALEEPLRRRAAIGSDRPPA